MAVIKKHGDVVTVSMTIQEAIMLGEIVEASGNCCARLARKAGDNPRLVVEAEMRMKQLWSLSDHLSTPTETNVTYTQDFRLP